LDYFHVEKDTADWQRERFRRHIAASNQSGKPMIIHTRNAKADTITISGPEYPLIFQLYNKYKQAN
jgi:TatD DNase family protein